MISNRSTAQLKIRPLPIARSGEQIWRRRVLWSALLITFSIGFITLAAAAKLEAPFRSDQSLFLLYARMLSRGFKLYVDIWDIKQPAIYWFYLASAEIFSYTERGIHLGEFVLSAAFSICLISTLRNYFAHWALVALSPLVVVGSYFLQVGATEQTQVEGLIGFPLYLCAYFCCRATQGDHRKRDALLFGMFAALVCLFKMIFIVIIGSFVLVALYLYPKARPPLDKRAFLIYSASGFFAVWAAVATVLIVRQEFWGFYQVTFVYPFAALSEFPPGRPVDLLKGIGFIAGIFAPWACFLVIAAWWGVRRDGAIMTRILLAWVIAGVVITLAQRFSWWIYHFLIFLVPLGILALRGVDVLLAELDRDGRAASLPAKALAIVLVASPIGAMLAQLGSNLSVAMRFLDRGTFRADQFRKAYSENYAETIASIEVLPKLRSDESVYSLANSYHYLLLDRLQYGKYSGGNWLYLTSREKAEQLALLSARPPDYMFVKPEYVASSPALAQFLSAQCNEYAVTSLGNWFKCSAGVTSGHVGLPRMASIGILPPAR
jgi:hypothetical protein